VFLLNGLVFFLIGLQLPEIVGALRTEGISLSAAIGYGLLVTAVLIITRIISSYIALIATLIFRPSVTPRSSSTKMRWCLPLLLGWTGMRGVVSLAAALAIPVTLDNGVAFPQRNLILFITFEAILLTLLVQGLTLPYFIRKSGLFDVFASQHSEDEMKMKMKKDLKAYVHKVLKDKYEHELHEHQGMHKFMEQWEERAKATDDNWMNEKTKIIFVELLESQRDYLTALNKDPNFDEEIIRQQLYQIDLEEERLKII
jgi:CPA1 family monovalent cation:H+ antiporter